MSVSFRRLRKTDFFIVRDLARRAWIKAYAHIGAEKLEPLVEKYYSNESLGQSFEQQKRGYGIFLLAVRKKPVGFCHVARQGRSGELYRLYVEPSLIGRGIGYQMLLRAERFLRKHNVRHYKTFVNHHNKRGLSFYLRNGFVRDARRDRNDEFEKKALWFFRKWL